MRVYRCKFIGLVNSMLDPITDPHDVRARVEMLDNHERMGAQIGGITITSVVKSIDFERGLILTQNNIYKF